MLNVGNRVKIYGGYFEEPKWLKHDEHVVGEVVGFILDQDKQDLLVIKLEEEFVVGHDKGSYLVLGLRYENMRWDDKGIVSVELCDFIPEDKPWELRKHGKGVETAATYEKTS